VLREFHEALLGQLTETFPQAQVRKHAGEVDVETVRRHALRRVNLWATVASGEGTDDASDTELRMLVEWAVFVIVGAAFEVVEDGQGKARRRRAEPVEVAEAYAEDVLRLAYDNDWSLEGCAKARKTDLSFSNLGVALKTTAHGVDKADFGLFVVWGRQQLELGENLLPGHAKLPPFSGYEGDFENQGSGGAGAGAGFHEELDSSPQALLWSAAGTLVDYASRFVRSQLRRAA
jgi:hypothetical protein